MTPGLQIVSFNPFKFCGLKFRGMHVTRMPYTLRMCDQCLARKDLHAPDSMNYRNFSESAAYGLTVLSHEQYVAIERSAIGSASQWLCMPGWRLETNVYDMMHCVYLGTGRDLIASGLCLLIEHGAYAHADRGDRNKLLAHIHREMRGDCKSHGRFVS